MRRTRERSYRRGRRKPYNGTSKFYRLKHDEMDKIVDSRVEEILDKLAKDTIEKKNTFLEKWLKSK